MSTTKRHSARAVRLQDQTSKLKLQVTTEATPASQTTQLNNIRIGGFVVSDTTVKYKATGRYNFNWIDPRMMTFADRFEDVKTILHPHYAQDMTDEQLKAAWILVYGDRPVTFNEIKQKWALDEIGDDMRVAQETHLRGLLLSQHDFASIYNIYILKDKLHASS